MRDEEWAIVQAECSKETAKAILVLPQDGDEDVWVPKSVISEDSEVQGEGDSGTLIVKTWFARNEGLI